MLKWNLNTFLFQVHIMMLNPNVLPQNQHRKHDKCLQITDGAQLHHWYLLLPVFSVDYHMWMSLRTSWSVFLSVCFTSASWRGLLQPETNSSASSTSPTVHTHTHTHTSGVGDTDSVFFSVHQLYRSLTAVLSSHPPLSMTVNGFSLTLLHWDCTSH